MFKACITNYKYITTVSNIFLHALTDTDFCQTSDNSTICGNHGRCVSTADTFVCLCDAYFTGRRCEVDIDDCSHVTCLHNGTCVDGLGQHTCICPPQYSGMGLHTFGYVI